MGNNEKVILPEHGANLKVTGWRHSAHYGMLKRKRHFPKQLKSHYKPKVEREYTGLCSNCAHRETCTFPKAKGGVMFCDEYE